LLPTHARLLSARGPHDRHSVPVPGLARWRTGSQPHTAKYLDYRRDQRARDHALRPARGVLDELRADRESERGWELTLAALYHPSRLAGLSLAEHPQLVHVYQCAIPSRPSL